MDRAFAKLVTAMGLSLVDAATICATTPARALHLQGFGESRGATADLVVLDRDLNVVHTFIGGALVQAEAPKTLQNPSRTFADPSNPAEP